MRLTRRHMAGASAGALCLATLRLVSPASASEPGDQAEVTRALEAFRKAMVEADRKQFETLCADQLSYGHSSGKLQTKAVFIDDATSGKSVWKSLTFADPTVQIAGNNAITRFTFIGESESEGKSNAVKIGVLMVWQKQDGNWKLLARQAFKI
jgi:ketosteroid isomerase-like protein